MPRAADRGPGSSPPHARGHSRLLVLRQLPGPRIQKLFGIPDPPARRAEAWGTEGFV